PSTIDCVALPRVTFSKVRSFFLLKTPKSLNQSLQALAPCQKKGENSSVIAVFDEQDFIAPFISPLFRLSKNWCTGAINSGDSAALERFAAIRKAQARRILRMSSVSLGHHPNEDKVTLFLFS